MSIEHPIALAPMGGSAGGELAAAGSYGGGLGLVGAGRNNRAWMERELAIVTAQTAEPWGIGFLTWAIKTDTIVWALDQHPHAIMLSFGDPGPYAARVRAAGVPLIIQVTDLDEAQRAVDVGADRPRLHDRDDATDACVVEAQGSGAHAAARPRRSRSQSNTQATTGGTDAAASVPALSMAGGKSDEWFRTSMRQVADRLPDAEHKTIDGQNHMLAAKAITPVLKEFFQ